MHTKNDLEIFQALPLDLKIEMTKTRIRQWMNKYDSYVSFSGGKDSTVLLHIARSLYPDIPAVFCDTGLEYPEIREFVKTFDNVIWLKPKLNFRQVIKNYGYPIISKEFAGKTEEYRMKPHGYAAQCFDDNSDYIKKYGKKYSLSKYKWIADSNILISDKCCDIMKKRPAKAFEKKTGLTPMLATMAVESSFRMSEWLKNGCNAYDAKRPVSKPMSFWTENDVLQYIKENNIPYASVYGNIYKTPDGDYRTTGCSRTGCVFCMFGCQCEEEPNRFQRLQKTHPQLWQYCMKPFDEGGLGIGDVLDFIGIEKEQKQISMFNEEDEDE